MRLPLLTLALSTVLSTIVVPQASFAYNLTGHWLGKFSCKGFDVEKYSGSKKDVKMTISQSGKSLRVLLKGVLYNGSALTNVDKPTEGQVVLIACTTDTALVQDAKFTAIVQAAVKTKSDVAKAGFSGNGIFEVWLSLHDEALETCKLSFTRLDTDEPSVPACPL